MTSVDDEKSNEPQRRTFNRFWGDSGRFGELGYRMTRGVQLAVL